MSSGDEHSDGGNGDDTESVPREEEEEGRKAWPIIKRVLYFVVFVALIALVVQFGSFFKSVWETVRDAIVAMPDWLVYSLLILIFIFRKIVIPAYYAFAFGTASSFIIYIKTGDVYIAALIHQLIRLLDVPILFVLRSLYQGVSDAMFDGTSKAWWINRDFAAIVQTVDKFWKKYIFTPGEDDAADRERKRVRGHCGQPAHSFKFNIERLLLVSVITSISFYVEDLVILFWLATQADTNPKGVRQRSNIASMSIALGIVLALVLDYQRTVAVKYKIIEFVLSLEEEGGSVSLLDAFKMMTPFELVVVVICNVPATIIVHGSNVLALLQAIPRWIHSCRHGKDLNENEEAEEREVVEMGAMPGQGPTEHTLTNPVLAATAPLCPLEDGGVAVEKEEKEQGSGAAFLDELSDSGHSALYTDSEFDRSHTPPS